MLVSLTDYSFAYDHFQKMRQLPQGKGKIVFTVDIRRIGTNSKVACSARPVVELLIDRHVWKRDVGRG